MPYPRVRSTLKGGISKQCRGGGLTSDSGKDILKLRVKTAWNGLFEDLSSRQRRSKLTEGTLRRSRYERKLKLKSKSLRVTGVTSARYCIDRSISYSDSDDDVDDGDADENTIDAGDDDSEEIGDTGEMGYWGNPLAR